MKQKETQLQTFERLYKDLVVDTSLLEKEEINLVDTIKESYIDLLYLRDKMKDTPNKMIIPKNFHQFLLSQDFIKLISKILLYSDELSKINKKQKVLNEEVQYCNYRTIKPQLLGSEVNRISEKAREISFVYEKILCKLGQVRDAKIISHDKYFFESMMQIIQNILYRYFDLQEFELIEEEINRLFRTNAFNKIKRQHVQEEYIKQYPELKDIRIKKEQKIDDLIINQLSFQQQIRGKIPKQLKSKSSKFKDSSDIRPLFINQTAGQSIQTRSPLIGMIYPTPQEQLFSFYQFVNKSNQAKSFSKSRNFKKFFDTCSQENQLNKSNLDQRRVYSSYCSKRNDLPNNSINFRQVRTGVNFFKQKQALSQSFY